MYAMPGSGLKGQAAAKYAQEEKARKDAQMAANKAKQDKLYQSLIKHAN